jgi:hypothetical protein
MLSKAEIAYLKDPTSVSPGYGYVLKNRIRSKLASMQLDISLLDGASLITEKSKSLTKNCKIQGPKNSSEITLNQNAFLNQKYDIGAPAGIWTRVRDSRGRYT